MRKTSQQRLASLAGVGQMTIGAFRTVFCIIPAPPCRSVLFGESFLTVVSFVFLICKVRETIANLTEIQESIGVKQEGPLSSVNAGLHGDELLEWSGGTKGLLPWAGILPGLYLFSRTTITQYHSLVA